FCGVTDQSSDGRWLPWVVHFPASAGLPGDSDVQRWSVLDYLARSTSLVLTLLRAIRPRLDDRRAGGDGMPGPVTGDLSESMLRLLRFGELASLAGILQALELLNTVVRNLPAYPRELILQFHEAIAAGIRGQLVTRIQGNDELRRLWEIVDLTLAVVRGIIRFGLVNDPRGFSAVDAYDCREWLKLNGASESSVNSAFVRALYDLAFAYEDGDVTRPRIAAGQALRGAVRAFFTYRGAFFWKMQAGMGDIVFAPFYEVLRRRGVRFQFFHRLTKLEIEPAAPEPGALPFVRALEFDEQAHIVNAAEYEPLIDVRGLPCWPAEPQWAQLVDGENLRLEHRNFESHWDRRRAGQKRLEVTQDFDLVVLAVGLGALPELCTELVRSSPRWKTMLETCKSVSTQAFQLWMNVDMPQLGWAQQQINISGFVEPFDTWADMRQLIPEESFQPPPRSIAYFCSVLPDPPAGTDIAGPDYPGHRYSEVRANAVTFLERHVAKLWPYALDDAGRFRWDVLCDPSGAEGANPASGEGRFSTQFWTANVNPSDRYSLSLPGTLEHRISPLERNFDNLTVAGDWTDCGFNEGCVEAAVMSGRLAAHAISRLPRLEEIVGYDHP
ncbi:MAG TPA: FAD-dependent oxidoreductase, partial [Polyangiaceae bacterium]|nr:FAD-dependent oxidoreductase [Polyangiaceae bacterium]